jgi:ferredoxin/flavodoxin---NADP+ reductase
MSEPQIAIVGSGPGGFFTAEALLKSDIGARIAMFDRLPTPYGLVRSGVAPDHQHIKQVVKVFDALAANPRFAFHGHVEIGRDVSIDWLRREYDAVVLAYGASAATSLSIPGSELAQCLTATDLVGWYNGHPDFVDIKPRFDHESAVVVGNGNVAVDIARILLSDHARLAKTDMADHALVALRESRVRCVHLVGRRGPAEASFTTAELRELLGLPGVRVVVDHNVLRMGEDEREFIDRPANAVIKRNIAAIADAASRDRDGAAKELHLDFLASPVAIEGVDRVEAVRLVRNRLQGPVDARRAVSGDERFSIAAGLMVASIGFRGKSIEGVPFDSRRGIIPNIEGRVAGVAGPGAPLYVAGWIKRGATGIIGTNRADAAETVRSLLSDFAAGLWSADAGRHRTGVPVPGSVGFSDWKRIDKIEQAAGAEAGRPRRKIVTVEQMMKVVGEGRSASESSQPAA